MIRILRDAIVVSFRGFWRHDERHLRDVTSAGEFFVSIFVASGGLLAPRLNPGMSRASVRGIRALFYLGEESGPERNRSVELRDDFSPSQPGLIIIRTLA